MGSENDSDQQEELRTEVLEMLAEKPRSGMDLISALHEREDNPKVVPPLTMYPLLEDLNAEGLVRLCMAGGAGSRQRPYELTEVGRFVLQGAPAEPGFAQPDEAPTQGEATRIAVRTGSDSSAHASGQYPPGSLEEAAQRLWDAAEEIRHEGAEGQVEQAHRRIEMCIRELRRILAAGRVDAG